MFDTTQSPSFYGDFAFDLNDSDEHAHIALVAKALSHPLRLALLKQILRTPCSVTELAKMNGLTNSTIIFHLSILEQAHLVVSKTKPNKKGKTLIFYNNFKTITLSTEHTAERTSVVTQSTGVGSYIHCKPTQYIRIATKDHFIVWEQNDAYNPLRHNAELICIDNGEVVYAFSNAFARKNKVERLEFSLELSSESPFFCNDWKSEIFFSVNGVAVCSYLSLGDYGGERGSLTPDWWDDRYSQFGMLTTVAIDGQVLLLNGKRTTDRVTLDDLALSSDDKITLSLATHPSSKFAGGFNIFGKSFGNYTQDIVLKAYLAGESAK